MLQLALNYFNWKIIGSCYAFKPSSNYYVLRPDGVYLCEQNSVC